MAKFIDRTGLKYGRLLVCERVDAGPASNGNRVKWRCKCDCGNSVVATGHSLQRGETSSCGCLRKEMVRAVSRTHGMSRSPTHNSWRAAKERCHNPQSSKYPFYGGVGITMCDRWRNSFAEFLVDMGERPQGHTLDRIDQCKGYEPGNVRWATAMEQSVNRGTTRLHRWGGTWMTIREVSEAAGVPFNSLRKAIRKHRTIQSAVAYVASRMDP